LIFKESIKDVYDTIEKIKDIRSGAYIGTDGLFDSKTVKLYAEQLRSLSKAEAEASLSSIGLTRSQKAQVLSSLELNTATKALTVGQIEEQLALKTNNAENAKAITQKLTKAGIISAETGATTVLTTEIIKEAVANGVLSASEAQIITTSLGLTIANGTLASSFKILTGVVWANIKAFAVWLTTTPVGWVVLATGAIAGLVGIIDLATTSTKEHEEQLEELKGEYSELESELESVNSELKTTEERMKELEKLDSLSFVEKEEYDNLVKTNNELERQKSLLEAQLKLKNQEKNKAFLDTMNSDAKGVTYTRDSNGNQIELAGKYNLRYWDDFLISNYKSAKERLDEGAVKTYEQKMHDQYDEYAKRAEGISYIPEPSNEDERKVNEWLDFIEDYQDRMMIALGGDKAKTNAFNRIVDNWKFDELTQKLQDLGNQGKVTASMLEDHRYDAFIQKLVDLGVVDTADNLEDIALAFNKVAIESGKAAIDTSAFSISEDDAKKLSDYQSKIDSISKSLGNLYNLEAGDITKIMGDFEAYDFVFEKWGVTGENGVGNLKAALEEIATKLKDTATTAVPQMTNAIEEMYDIIRNPKGSIDKFSSEIEELETVLEKARAGENIDGIETLINKYGDLEGSVIKLNDGYSLEEDAIISLLNTRIESYNSAIAYDAEYTKQCIDNIEKRAEAMFKVEAGALRAIADVRRTNSEYTTRVYAKQKYGIDDTRFNLALKEGIALNELYKEYEELLEKIKTPFEKNDDKADKNNTIDWMTTSLANLQEKVDDANRKLENTNGLEAQKKAIEELNAELGNLKKAYVFAADEYNTRYKNALYGLNEHGYDPQDIQKKIEAGFLFDMDKFPEEVAELINDAIDAWNGKRDADNKVIELEHEIQDNIEQLPDLITSDFDRKLAEFENQANMIEAKLANAESKGLIATQEYYKALKEIESDKIGLKKDELKSLQIVFDEGKIEEGSDAWYDLRENIEEVKLEIQEAENAIVDFDNKISQVDWDVFNFGRKEEQKLIDEADFMIDLLASAKMFNDVGEMTAEGLATMGLHAQNYNAYLEDSISLTKQLANLQKKIDDGTANKNDKEWYDELIELRQESILSAEAEKQSMIDLVTEGVDLQKEAFQELIDKYTEALDVQKDLYSYQKRNSEQTKKIASIQKQLAAYSGDNSDEARAKVQQLKVQLDEEQGNLEEQQYSRYIDDQKEMLSTIYENYETALNSYLDNAVKVIADSIDTVNAGTSEINETIKDKAEDVGLELSGKIDSVWNNEDKTLKDGFNGVSENVKAEKGVLSEIKLENIKIADAQKEEIASEVQMLLAQDNISNEISSSIKNNTDSIISIINAMAESLNKLVANSTQTFSGSSITNSAIEAMGSNNGVVYSSNGNIYKPLPSDNKSIISNKSGMLTSTPTTVQTILKDSAYVPAAVVKTNNTGNSIGEVNNNIEINCPNVTDYNSLVKQLQADKKFEKVIVDITSSALTGSSSLSKYRHQLK